MKMYIFPIVILLFFMVIYSCNNKKIDTPAEPKIPLQGLYDIWGLKVMHGIPYTGERGVVLELNTEKMSVLGNAHCNRIFGKISSTGAYNLEFVDMGSTKMACQDLKEEQIYLTALENTKSYQIKNLHLLLFDENGKQLLDFVKMD